MNCVPDGLETVNCDAGYENQKVGIFSLKDILHANVNIEQIKNLHPLLIINDGRRVKRRFSFNGGG